MASLIAVGTSSAYSSEITVAVGASVRFLLIAAGGPNAVVSIQIKDSTGAWNTIGTLSAGDGNITDFNGPGTVRVYRAACNADQACGVDQL